MISQTSTSDWNAITGGPNTQVIIVGRYLPNNLKAKYCYQVTRPQKDLNYLHLDNMRFDFQLQDDELVIQFQDKKRPMKEGGGI
ncbi:hypothetical protein HYFRA_00002442 [Hymenoscyphus fraxineus]|uniref:Uncharacterized protein n=1 Tax=Hymenoscyphus fraxineus TaxID=746836 RepID=A0A9N9PZ00_9HELO|nr:hypothetical protein HYFRA_00002442 [Hymenoscyphus fraxineus]